MYDSDMEQDHAPRLPAGSYHGDSFSLTNEISDIAIDETIRSASGTACHRVLMSKIFDQSGTEICERVPRGPNSVVKMIPAQVCSRKYPPKLLMLS